jgi:alkanesulfonate monooxygenase SsuD/methylene tetrahydromethanopterin reductase-like flavin-dependent oxidoreductase (luciferase family)
VARLEECIAVLHQAWSGEPVTGGRLVSYPGMFVTPRPSRPAGLPIWIGAINEPAVRRAGRLADGFMATEVTPTALARQVAWAREERERAGKEPAELTISLHLPTFPWLGDLDDAWERRRPFHRYVAWKYDDMDGARRRSGPCAAAADHRTGGIGASRGQSDGCARAGRRTGAPPRRGRGR